MRDLLDKQALKELVTRISRTIDCCEPELLLSCSCEDADDDHGAYQEEAAGLVAHLARGDEPANGSVQHAVTNLLFELDDDTAYGEMHVQSRMVDADGTVASTSRSSIPGSGPRPTLLPALRGLR